MTASQSTSGVLDSIDGAIRDYETSSDAMRWRPGGEREAEPAPPRSPWFDLSGATIVLNRPLATAPDVRQTTPLLSPSAFTGSVSGPLYPQACEDLAAFGRALAETFRPLVEWASRMVHDLHLLFFPSGHRRCLTCHPERKPKPLAVNGHEYQRRLRARRRRRA